VTSPQPPVAVVVHPDAATLAAAAAARLVTALLDTQVGGAPAHLVLTGGGIGGDTLAAVAAAPAHRAVDWSAVDIWWGDERFLATGDPQRNATQARKQLLDALALDPARVHEIAGPDRARSAAAAAADYAEQLAAAAARGGGGGGGGGGRDGGGGGGDARGGGGGGPGVPAFTVLLLGIGPEGHVASLFPGAGAGATGTVVAVHDSPKPPPERVSLTLAAIGAAEEVWLLASGTAKAEAVARSLGGASVGECPAAGARGRRTRYLLDRDAAGGLPTGLSGRAAGTAPR
jgi:6-phosphogluconolactonase